MIIKLLLLGYIANTFRLQAVFIHSQVKLALLQERGRESDHRTVTAHLQIDCILFQPLTLHM